MRAAARSMIVMGVAVAACAESARDPELNNAAVTDIEALPPDESVATSTEELANGAAEPTNGNAAQD